MKGAPGEPTVKCGGQRKYSNYGHVCSAVGEENGDIEDGVCYKEWSLNIKAQSMGTM